ncbi:hypothetical protein SynM161_01320 [Synechococcus sp. M16.1]|nr:hypothetical protein SynM161_01320 [Synechococcus sp. M16.1]
MAWEDRTPFEAIEFQFGLSEPQVIAVMRQQMKASSFKLWRKRVSGRKTKHAAISRFNRFSAGRPAGSLQEDQPDSCPRGKLSVYCDSSGLRSGLQPPAPSRRQKGECHRNAVLEW